MYFNLKILTSSLLASLLLLTGCNGNSKPSEDNLATLEESCFGILQHEGGSRSPDKLCPCFASEVKSNFPKNEQIIIADVMADGAAQMKNGNDNVDELTTIMAHSNFDATESKQFSDRVSDVMKVCINASR